MVSFWTFFLAIIFTWVTRSLIENVQSIIISFILLIIIIFIGIFFDMIGTAVTAADEKPFHAKAAKKIYGAKRGIYLVRNAEQVANFFNDVIGDISGVVSGVVAAVIIINLALGTPELSEIRLSILLAGIVSALTVGGKAVGKYFAINNPTNIVLFSARFLTTIDRLFFWKKHKR
jgi:CBS domain containing-hemolysin-like protein